MAQLFVPLTGGFQKVTGSGYNTEGEHLEWPHWRGAEMGALDTFPDVWGAVSESEFHDWVMGVHHPLYLEKGPAPCRFLDRDPVVREDALKVAATAAQAAHHVGARFILFPFPWPELPESEADWSEAEVYEASRKVFEHLAGVQENEKIKIALETAAPNRYFYEGDLYSRLFAEFPDLSLCLDTARLGLLAKTHGQDPLALCRRWLPWTRYMRLHTSYWDEQGTYHDRIPTNGTHTADRWPSVTPAAEMARLVVEAQPRSTIVLAHDPKAVSAAELETAHQWAAALVGL